MWLIKYYTTGWHLWCYDRSVYGDNAFNWWPIADALSNEDLVIVRHFDRINGEE